MGSEFWNMGGYAYYVWGSFGAAALLLLWNILAPLGRRRALIRLLADGAGDDHGSETFDESSAS